jgi:transcription initiation factor TFIID subunit TAF12
VIAHDESEYRSTSGGKTRAEVQDEMRMRSIQAQDAKRREDKRLREQQQQQQQQQQQEEQARKIADEQNRRAQHASDETPVKQGPSMVDKFRASLRNGAATTQPHTTMPPQKPSGNPPSSRHIRPTFPTRTACCMKCGKVFDSRFSRGKFMVF